MRRRDFLQTALAASAATPFLANVSSAGAEETAPTRSNASGPLLKGSPVLSGPAPDALTILQAVNGPATGFAEIRVGDSGNGEGDWRRIDAESAGLLPYDSHVLKFRLPALPSGAKVAYRVVATAIDFQNAYKILRGETTISAEGSFRTLDPAGEATRFVIWNDTHENQETIAALHHRTAGAAPDFVLWNGDQTNDVYDEAKMANQYLCPGGLAVADRWPLAYARGNHDVRGPAARSVARFTGTPDDRFYYAFRSGPVAVLVMDTGEDKPDDHPVFAGLAGFEAMRRRQAEWLKETTQVSWFREAPHKILCCHIPLWWQQSEPYGPPWSYSKPCREAWQQSLLDAGVKLVVSGHTHRHAWLPAKNDRPIGQLVGGGPQPSGATFTLATATPDSLTVEMSDLQGKSLYKVELPA
jgi:hypothetical protein